MGVGDEAQAIGAIGERKMRLFVGRCQPRGVGHDPDLQEMHRLRAAGVEFAVADAGARAHALHVPRPDHGSGAEAVLVLEFAGDDVRDDLHVAVTVRRKTRAGCDLIVVDDPQAAKAHVAGVVIFTKRKRMPAVEPAQIRMAAFGPLANDEHDREDVPEEIT